LKSKKRININVKIADMRELVLGIGPRLVEAGNQNGNYCRSFSVAAGAAESFKRIFSFLSAKSKFSNTGVR
jgi:hypothetical protein